MVYSAPLEVAIGAKKWDLLSPLEVMELEVGIIMVL